MSRTPKLTNKALEGLCTAVAAWLSGEPEENEEGEIDVERVEAVEEADRWLEAVVACRSRAARPG
jgi:hypothetical protein